MTEAKPETTAPAPSFLLCWVGDGPNIRAWLDAHRISHDFTERGRRGAYEITVHQLIPGRYTPKVTAHVGDRLYLDDGLLKVRKRTPNKRVPPPGATREPRGRARRNRSGSRGVR